MAKPLSLTIVIPVFNEEENLPELIDRLEKLVPQMGRPCNVLFIEDGSQDGTYALLAKARERLPWIGILKFARNFGQHWTRRRIPPCERGNRGDDRRRPAIGPRRHPGDGG